MDDKKWRVKGVVGATSALMAENLENILNDMEDKGYSPQVVDADFLLVIGMKNTPPKMEIANGFGAGALVTNPRSGIMINAMGRVMSDSNMSDEQKKAASVNLVGDVMKNATIEDFDRAIKDCDSVRETHKCGEEGCVVVAAVSMLGDVLKEERVKRMQTLS